MTPWNNDTKTDNVHPSGKWVFDGEVTNCFANMLERSIPDYRGMRSLVYETGRLYVKPKTTIIDIGASTGLSAKLFVQEFHSQEVKFFLIDNSEPMVKAARERFALFPNVYVACADSWEILKEVSRNTPGSSSLVLSVLSLQFMPTSYRQTILGDIYKSLADGGAFILVEKVVSTDLDDMMVDLYYKMKRDNGYSEDQIKEKRKSLENVLSPLRPEWNVDMLRSAGFRKVDMFWRCLNFCGWVAVK